MSDNKEELLILPCDFNHSTEPHDCGCFCDNCLVAEKLYYEGYE